MTDPQISSAQYNYYSLHLLNLTIWSYSTTRSLGPIFAEGNVPSIHQDFKKKHVCNEFCKWFNIPTDYESDSKSPSEPESDSDSDPWLEVIY